MTNSTGKNDNAHTLARIPNEKIMRVLNLTRNKKLKPRAMTVWTFLFNLSADPSSKNPTIEMSILEIAAALKMSKTTLDRCMKELVDVGLVKPIYRVGFMRDRKKLFQFNTFKEAREFTKLRKANMFKAHYQI